MNNQSMVSRERGILMGILFLVSFVVLMYQVVLTRVFSFLFWHHFAYMVISIALLGYGLAGSYIASSKQRCESPLASSIAALATLSITTVFSLYFVLFFNFSSMELFSDPLNFLAMLVDYLVMIMPFAAAGYAVATIYSSFPKQTGMLYAADMVGGAMGCLCLFLFFALLNPLRLVLLLSMVTALISLVLHRRVVTFSTEKISKQLWIRTRLFATVALLASLGLFPISTPSSTYLMKPEASKEMYSAMIDNQGNFTHVPEWTGWHLTSRVDVMDQSKGGNFSFGGEIAAAHHRTPVARKIVFQDGAAPTFIYPWSENLDKLPFLRLNNQATAYRCMKGPEVLVIGSGGGPDLLIALANGAKKITAVEINPLISSLVTGPYKEFTNGLFSRKEVTLHNQDGRTFVRNSKEKFDIIQLSGVDTFAALSSGAYSASENYLYTKEAINDYLEHLKPGGLITFSRWVFTPPRECLRLFNTALLALESRTGVTNPRQHLALIKVRQWATLLVSPAPFTVEQMTPIRQHVEECGFQFLHDPMANQGGIYDLFAFAPEMRQELTRRYQFNVAPVTDDNPYFFNFYRWASTFSGQQGKGGYFITTMPVGNTVILASLLQISFVGLLAILFPLYRRREFAAGNRLPIFLYFAGIGLGFIAVEIVFIQKFVVFLGHPGYSLTIVLPALLLSAGLGSLLSQHLPLKKTGALHFLLLILLFVYMHFLGPIIAMLHIKSLLLRFLTVFALIAPLGILMGMPFPTGIAKLASEDKNSAAWAYGINSFATVFGSIFIAMLSMELGFTFSLFFGLTGYIVAFVVLHLPGCKQC